MQRKNLPSLFICALCCAGLLAGCSARVPKLKPMEVNAPVQTIYTDALNDLNMVLETYLPPSFPDTYFAIKKVTDATGIAQSSGGEIPADITALVQDAFSQVYHKLHYVQSYDSDDAQNLDVEKELRNQNRVIIEYNQAERPDVDFTIVGRISQFDRNLESTSDKYRAMAAFGGGYVRTDLEASAEKTSRLSRLALSFSVFDFRRINVPGKFGASMEVMYAKNGVDLGFAVYGNGLGYGTEATAMHGRHEALKMMTEFSVVQIIGRVLNVPYWRVGASKQIFARDQLVINTWRNEEYKEKEEKGTLIAFMQAQCIANGAQYVQVTNQLDEATRAAFDNFATKYGVKNRTYPNADLYCALEENRVLSRAWSARAWNAWEPYAERDDSAAPVAKPASKSVPSANVVPATPAAPIPAQTPAVSTTSAPVKKPAVSHVPAPAQKSVPARVKSRPTRSSAPAASDDPVKALNNLL